MDAIYEKAIYGDAWLKELLRANVDINTPGRNGITALHLAAASGKLQVATLLVANKADLDLKDTDGSTGEKALDFAERHGRTEVAAFLRDQQLCSGLAQAKREKEARAADSCNSSRAGTPEQGAARTDRWMDMAPSKHPGINAVPTSITVQRIDGEDYPNDTGEYFHAPEACNFDIFQKADNANALFFYVSGSSPESKRGSWRTSSGPGASADPHSESLGSGSQYPAYGAHEYGKHYADTQDSQWSVTFNFGAEPLEQTPTQWRDAVDTKGRTYYWNKITKETRWTAPPGGYSQTKRAAAAKKAAAEAAAAKKTADEAAAAKEALPSLAELDLAMATNEPIKLSAQHLHLITDNFSGALLGKGGQGSVTIGKWGDLLVAVKSMKTDDLLDDRGFAAELATLKQCGDHPNIMKLYGYYDKSSLEGDEEDLGANFFVMPLMKGDLLKMMTTMGWKKRLQALLDALKGLQELHKRNFLHWDIKPANILIHDGGTACLADCSLSKQMDDGVLDAQTSANYSTILGAVGTPGYTDPAYMQSGVYHRYSDVYSMAIVMLQLLTSEPTPQKCDDGLPLMSVLSFCDMKYDEGKFMEAADHKVWSEVPEVVEALLDLAMRCSDGSRERISKKRPTVEQCITELTEMLQSDVLSQAIDEPSAEAMQLSAQTLTGHTITLHVSTSTTIAQVKSMIELQDSGIPAEGMVLLCIPKQGRNMLPNSDSLESLQISDGDVLKIVVGRR